MTKSIYIIKNKINNKVYVGQAINPHRRFIQHLCNGNRLLDNYPIHLAINKYGKENFYYEILEQNIENYDEREHYWITYYNSVSPNGYNILAGNTTNPVMYGENHPRNTLSDQTVNDIIEELLFTNKSQRKIAIEHNTTERVINSIVSGESHKQDSLQYPLRIKGCHFSQQTLEEIIWLLQSTNASLNSIAEYYNFTKGTIAQINNGKSHYNPNFNYPLREKTGVTLFSSQITKLLIQKLKEENINVH